MRKLIRALYTLTMFDPWAPPVNRTMRTLDRSFFRKSVPVTAAVVKDVSQLQDIKKSLKDKLIGFTKMNPVVDDPVPVMEGEKEITGERRIRKIIPLHPSIRKDDPSTLPRVINELVEQGKIQLIPWTLELEYKDWNYDELIRAILPEEFGDDIPHGFTLTGHIAHLNLREQFLPYKYIIAELILDKNPRCKTVVNKIDEVGVASEFRTFQMEVLAGELNTLTTVSESDCQFTFDFAKVYWNSRLSTEHKRIYSKFHEGEAVADVMAGVGPFAIPSGKRKVFAWANDLNPDSYEYLKENIKKNKVGEFVSAHCEDGKVFIKRAIRDLYKLSQNELSNTVLVPPKVKNSRFTPKHMYPPPTKYKIPSTFSHFVMNLPARALEFLDAFIGSHAGMEELFQPYTTRKLPMIHVHCFQKPGDDAYDEICKRISHYMDHPIECKEVEFTNVRLVAPNKVMYCASFRLPPEVAFATPGDRKSTTSTKAEEKEKRAWWANIKAWLL